MDAGDFEQLKAYLKENLQLDTKEHPSAYGASGYVTIKLKLEDKVISEVYIDIPTGG